MLFFGGDAILQIRGILKIEKGRWVSFTRQLDAIQAIRSLAKGSFVADGVHIKTRNAICQMIRAILNDDLVEGIKSPYIRELLRHQINSAPIQVTYDWTILLHEWRFLEEFLLNDLRHPMPHVVNMCKLFPRSDCILFVMPDAFEVESAHWMSILSGSSVVQRRMTVEMEWETDVGDVITKSFASLLTHVLSMRNVQAFCKDQVIKIIFTPPSITEPDIEIVEIAKEPDLPQILDDMLVEVPTKRIQHGKCPNICINLCICDWVSPLTYHERVECLFSGYIRESSSNKAPDAVRKLCWNYIGGLSGFEDDEMFMSLKESGLDCCGYNTECGSWRPPRNRYLSEDCLGFSFWALRLFIMAADIAAIVIASIYDCNNVTLSSEAQLGSLGITTWMFVGAIVDIVIPCTLFWLGETSENIDIDVLTDAFDSWSFWMKVQGLGGTFLVIWCIFGFILYVDMDPNHSCSQMVLSWNIIQMFGIILLFVLTCLVNDRLRYFRIEGQTAERFGVQIKNALVVCVIDLHQRTHNATAFQHSRFAADLRKDLQNVKEFAEHFGYTFIAMEQEREWTDDAFISFLQNRVAGVFFDESGDANYDGLILGFSGAVYRDLTQIIYQEYPDFRDFLCVFLFDAGRGMLNLGEMARNNEELPPRIPVHKQKEVDLDMEHAHDKLAVIHAAQDGFSAISREKTGSYMTFLFTKKLIQSHEEKSLGAILEEISVFLYDSRKQPIETELFGNMRNLRFAINPIE